MGCTGKCSPKCNTNEKCVPVDENTSDQCHCVLVFKNTNKFKKKYKIMYENFKNNKINFKYNAFGGYDIVTSNNIKNDLSKWNNHQKDGPVQYYPEIVKQLGEPDVKVNSPGGICIWYVNGRDKIHEEIWLRDERIEHSNPAKHVDYFYSYVKVYIPYDKLLDVLSISGSIGYDKLKKLLYARCATFEANYATIRTAFEVLNSIKTNYGKNINNREIEMISNKDYVLREIKKNNKQYSKELKLPYYDFQN